MRSGWMWALVGLVALAPGVGAQTVGAGLSVGYTQLGGLEAFLSVKKPFALSGSAFLDFTLGPTSGWNPAYCGRSRCIAPLTVRLLGNLALVQDSLLSAFETDLFWSFPLGQAVGFLGAGTGLVGLPPALAPTLSFSVQALGGLQTELLDFALVKVTVQALKVIVLNQGFVPGAPLVRIEVGVTFPLPA